MAVKPTLTEAEMAPSLVLLVVEPDAVPDAVPDDPEVPDEVPDGVADELELLALASLKKASKVLLPVVGALTAKTIPEMQ
jgi:hypothetical protein